MAAGTSDPTKGQQHLPRLDVLVNKVGGYRNSRHVTADGLQRTFALNHLASFLLTDLLLDRLRDSAPARVVTISSSARTGSAPPAHADGAAATPVPCTEAHPSKGRSAGRPQGARSLTWFWNPEPLLLDCTASIAAERATHH